MPGHRAASAERNKRSSPARHPQHRSQPLLPSHGWSSCRSFHSVPQGDRPSDPESVPTGYQAYLGAEGTQAGTATRTVWATTQAVRDAVLALLSCGAERIIVVVGAERASASAAGKVNPNLVP